MFFSSKPTMRPGDVSSMLPHSICQPVVYLNHAHSFLHTVTTKLIFRS